VRVISSTVQGLDIAAEAEDAFYDTVEAGKTVRETYSLDQIGQKEYRTSLVAYTDPDGEHRWAVLYDDPQETDWTDTADLDEAVAEYERQVCESATLLEPTYDGEGNTVRPAGFDYSDVEDVEVVGGGTYGAWRVEAAAIAAGWATERLAKVQQDAARAVEAAAAERALAVTRLVDTFGRGGQTYAASALGISQPAVSDLVRRGRALLDDAAAAARPAPWRYSSAPFVRGTDEALALANTRYLNPRDAETILREGAAEVLGWTFAADQDGTTRYGWVREDGTVCRTLRATRGEAGQYGRRGDDAGPALRFPNPTVTNSRDALMRAQTLYTASEAVPFAAADGDEVLGWTFAVRRPGNGMEYGWVLADGRVSPALEWYRDDAMRYGANTVGGY
jgi:hypothetical protein